jgi:hypothetical protein
MKTAPRMEWFTRDVMIPLMGEGAYGATGETRGLLGQLDHLISKVHHAAADAQAGALDELVDAEGTLKQLAKDFSEAVKFAKSRAAVCNRQRGYK